MQGVAVRGAAGLRFDEILTRNTLAFVADLHRRFDATRKRLLARRSERQRRFDIGELPDFLAETSQSVTATGRSGRSPRTCRTAASSSPGRSTARWSSTR